MPDQPAEGIQHRQAIAFLRNTQRPECLGRHTAGQWIRCRADCLMTLLQDLRRLFRLAAVAPRAGTAGYIARVLLLGRCQRRQAPEALRRIGFLQRRIDADTLVEDETLTAIMRTTAFLEVLEDAAIQLQHIAEAL